jgi:dGTPase
MSLSALAPYAMNPEASRGRAYPEPDDDPRCAFQRDRDRIVHSGAFRRLSYKTQVFVNHEGDYYRTRLTHTLEVAQVGRAIARSLRLNEDLTEAIVLAHDLGHAPFGHSGQDVLDDLMTDHGGFEHNRQSLRIVDLLERRYAGFRGLNLSYETRDSILKRGLTELRAKLGLDVGRRPLLEAQVADLSDSIAYDQHDIDDALKAGLVDWSDLAELPLWRRALEELERVAARAGPCADLDKRVRRREAVRYLIGLQVRDVVATTGARLEQGRITSADAARDHSERLVGLSPELEAEKVEFQRFLQARVYRHYRMRRMAGKARRFLTLMFEQFVADPDQLSPEHREWVERVGLHRGVCDYIAGMTDRYAQREVERLTEPFSKT